VIVFKPIDFLKKIAPPSLVKRLVTNRLTVNQAVLTMLARSGVMTKKSLEALALKIIKQYREKFRSLVAEGEAKSRALQDALAERKLIVQRVQGAIVEEIADDIKKVYRGERYVWLPSTADEPDPLHQLFYGKKRRIGVGEMPGDRFGCKCGMKILVDDDELEL
jgi:hypothetical protein